MLLMFKYREGSAIYSMAIKSGVLTPGASKQLV